jgi:acyl-CoA thioesterase I
LIADPAVYLNELVIGLARQWPDNRTANIICHGHSVPAGYFATPFVNTLAAYPYQVLEQLKERFPFAVINVIVTAIGGEDSESGAARFETEVLCHRPDALTIDYALNDRAIGLKRAETAWRSMIETALLRSIKVILLTPTLDQIGLRSGDPSSDEELSRHADQVRSLAMEYHLGLADSHAVFQNHIDNGGHLFDLLSHINHPNSFGHRLVAMEILKYFPAQ